MKKVLVIGSSGAGKSTLSVRLGKLLGIEVIHLDALNFRAGWVETPKAEWRSKVENLVKRDSWIIDGNYSGTLDVRLAACDTVVFLDLSRTVCLRRVLKRFFKYRGGSRPDVTEGCREKIDFEFVRWIWTYPTRSRPKVLKLLDENSPGKNIVRLRSQADVENFFAGVTEMANKPSEPIAR
jgi:adenylate kinase family enzyme